MAQYIRANDNFGDAFSRTFAQSLHYAQQEAERKRQEEQNKAIAQMYLESVRQPADAAVAPYQQNATNKIMQANTADSNLSAVNAPITTAPDRLADTRSLRFLSMTPEERARAGITPEQSTQMNTAMQAEGPINMQQANAGVAQTLAPIAQQANNQAQSAEQMLAMAKEKYGTAMFDRLAPIVASGKFPAQAMISIIKEQVQTAEKQAIKQATANAVKILSDPKADPAQKQGVLAQLMTDNPQAARGIAEAFGLKPVTPPATITPGSYVRQADGSYVQMGQSSNQVVSANTIYTQQQENERARLRLQDKEPKKPEWEKEHHDYETTQGMKDAQEFKQYQALTSGNSNMKIDPDSQSKYDLATARINKYLSQENVTADEQTFLGTLDRKNTSKEQAKQHLIQYRMNKLNGIRQ